MNATKVHCFCTKKNCSSKAFVAEKETFQSKPTANSQFYSTSSWLPLSICMERMSSGAVRAYSTSEPSEKPIETVRLPKFCLLCVP